MISSRLLFHKSLAEHNLNLELNCLNLIIYFFAETSLQNFLIAEQNSNVLLHLFVIDCEILKKKVWTMCNRRIKLKYVRALSTCSFNERNVLLVVMAARSNYITTSPASIICLAFYDKANTLVLCSPVLVASLTKR